MLPTQSAVSLVARSPDLDAQAVACVVTVPTFRRPEHLVATLRSLAAQRTARRFAVIVMENDAEGRAGAAAAAPLFSDGTLAGLVIVAHERGNCCAYNAGWETALLTFPAFDHLLVIDDDEIATPDWLETMCRTSETLGAAIVGGPQVPRFAAGTSPGWAEHPVFAPPYRETGRVARLFSSGNLLIGRPVLQAMAPPFLDLRFNFMGGGDSDFLARAADRGFTLAWCAEAPVEETIPAGRLEAGWIRKRGLRNGVISALVERKRRGGQTFGRAVVVARSLALLALAPWRGLKHYRRSGLVSAAIDPFRFGAGRLLAEFGYANEQYRQSDGG